MTLNVALTTVLRTNVLHCDLHSVVSAMCRIAELEKDLYYYKTTSREFKKKLRNVSRDGAKGEHDDSIESATTNRDIAGGDSGLPLQGLSKHCILFIIF